MNAIELVEILKENPDFITSLQNRIEEQEKEIEKLKDVLGIQDYSDNSLLKAVAKIKEQAKEIEQLKADLNIEKECYDKIEKHNLYLKNTHKHLRAIVIEKNEEIEQLKKQINILVVSREPKIGDRVILLDDESEGIIESLSIAGGPRINFDDGCYGYYTRFELITLFAYKESE